jgi:hypothetical protein
LEYPGLLPRPAILRLIKSSRVRRVSHVAGISEMRNSQRILVGNLKGRDSLGDLSIYGKII